jgi:sulfide dehydrogenase cytochrome subunit
VAVRLRVSLKTDNRFRKDGFMALAWKNRKAVTAALIGAAGLLSASAAQAQAPAAAQSEISRGAVIATTCYACHGTYGVSPGAMPSINEISADNMISMLKGFRSGLRASTVMGRHATGYTDEEIVEVSQYLGNLQKRGK